jgi:bifunctional DNase/RNase
LAHGHALHINAAFLGGRRTTKLFSDVKLNIIRIAKKRRKVYDADMDEGRKRVLAIVAGIIVARHIKNSDELFDARPSPRTESLIAAAVQWSERIMRKIDRVFEGG